MLKTVRITTTIIFSFLTCIQGVHAQSKMGQQVPTPEFNYEIMYLNADNTLTKLEKVEVKFKQHIGIGFPSPRAKSFLEIEGKTSPISHTGAPTDHFIVRVELGVNPTDVFELDKFESEKDIRRIPSVNTTVSTAFSKPKRVAKTQIPLNVMKIVEGVYILTFDQQLESGEYVFMKDRHKPGNSLWTGYCFTVPKGM